ncbi:hypothetical protein H6P81_009231 [Aristolochia fimbriata]|uniref:Uncharacterized protein n=1 Tax=Aristolochia fimbriata TaxID=158543 RepID=A0AAV7ENG6_ARIFI|nr:hypothetical protein H6P81_009231 [Aristolochia fimbriata]
MRFGGILFGGGKSRIRDRLRTPIKAIRIRRFGRSGRYLQLNLFFKDSLHPLTFINMRPPGIFHVSPEFVFRNNVCPRRPRKLLAFGVRVEETKRRGDVFFPGKAMRQNLHGEGNKKTKTKKKRGSCSTQAIRKRSLQCEACQVARSRHYGKFFPGIAAGRKAIRENPASSEQRVGVPMFDTRVGHEKIFRVAHKSKVDPRVASRRASRFAGEAGRGSSVGRILGIRWPPRPRQPQRLFKHAERKKKKIKIKKDENPETRRAARYATAEFNGPFESPRREEDSEIWIWPDRGTREGRSAEEKSEAVATLNGRMVSTGTINRLIKEPGRPAGSEIQRMKMPLHML